MANGLQYSQNYQQQASQLGGQPAAPFRRKASNTNKQSLTHLKNSSLPNDEEAGTPEDAASTEAFERHMAPGFSAQGIDVDVPNSGATQPNQGMCLTSESLGARGGAGTDKTNSGSIQLA